MGNGEWEGKTFEWWGKLSLSSSDLGVGLGWVIDSEPRSRNSHQRGWQAKPKRGG